MRTCVVMSLLLSITGAALSAEIPAKGKTVDRRAVNDARLVIRKHFAAIGNVPAFGKPNYDLLNGREQEQAKKVRECLFKKDNAPWEALKLELTHGRNLLKGKSPFTYSPYVTLAVNGNPEYGRPGLVDILKSDATTFADRSGLISQLDRLNLPVYWMPDDLWLKLIAEMLENTGVHLVMGGFSGGKPVKPIKVRYCDLGVKMLVRSYRSEQLRDLKVFNLKKNPAIQELDKSVEASKKWIAAKRRRILIREALIKLLSDHRTARLTGDQIKATFSLWRSLDDTASGFRSGDFVILARLFLSEVAYHEKRGKPAQNSDAVMLDQLASHLSEIFTDVGQTISAPDNKQRREVTGAATWLKTGLKAIRERADVRVNPSRVRELENLEAWIDRLSVKTGG